MMEPERDGNNCYPWALYDANDFEKPWSMQLVPELQIRRSFKNKSHFHVLVNVKYISAEEITMKYDKEYLTIEGNYKEKKERGYQCYTAFKNVRRLKLPKGVDMANVDTWTSKNGYLNILAPIDSTPNKDGQRTIYYPCANSKTLTDIAKRTLNCVQEYRFEVMFKQLEAKTEPGPAAPQSQSGKPRPPARFVHTPAGNRRPPPGNIQAPATHVLSSACNIPARAVNVQVPANNMGVSAGNMRATSNMSICAGAPPRNMYPETENTTAQVGNTYSAPDNTNSETSLLDMRRILLAEHYNEAVHRYQQSRRSQEMRAPDYNKQYENIALYNRMPAYAYCMVPRREYIYAAEMDPNSIIE